MKVARYTAMLHVAFLKRGPGRARPDGRQGRPKPTSERDFMRRSPEPEEGGLQPPSYYCVAVLQAGTTATIFMSSGLTITTSSS